MINVNTITIEQFQSQFPNGIGGYSYLPIWSSTTSYNIDDIVYYNNAFYKAILANTNQTPPNTTYWTPYTANVYNYISDMDITTAFLIANGGNGSSGLFPIDIFCSDTDAMITYIYCLLIAHIILYFIKPQENAYLGQTVASLGVVTSQHVGNVSLANSVPSQITNDIFYTSLNSTMYGQQYLILVNLRANSRMYYSRGGIPN
jgi:hypothetical protein